MAAAARWGIAVGMSLGAILVPARVAPAGPVDFKHGEARLEAADVPRLVRPVSFPSTASYSIDGTDAAGSNARLRYDLRDVGGGSVFEVRHDHHGDARGSFSVTFTTARDLHYSLLADPAINFAATFHDVVADAFFDPLSAEDAYRGSLVVRDEETGEGVGFGARTFQGELPAGEHTFSVRAFGGVDRGTAVPGGGFARLTLAPEAIAIPLPPGAGTALAVAACACCLVAYRMAFKGAVAGGRRRRGSNGRRQRGCSCPARGGSSCREYRDGSGAW